MDRYPEVVIAGAGIGGLTAANNAAGAAAKADIPTGSTGNNDRPSIIIVEVLGYGGDSGDGSPSEPRQPDGELRKNRDQHSYNANSVLQLVGNGSLTDTQKQALTREERQELSR